MDDLLTIHLLESLAHSSAMMHSLKRDMDMLSRTRDCFGRGDPRWSAMDQRYMQISERWDYWFRDFLAIATQAGSVADGALRLHLRRLALAREQFEQHSISSSADRG